MTCLWCDVPLNLRQLDLRLPSAQALTVQYTRVQPDAFLALVPDESAIGFDSETTPRPPHTNALDPWQADMRLLAFVWDTYACVIDTYQYDPTVFLRALAKKRCSVCAHNALFDAKFLLWHYRIHFDWVCTLILWRTFTNTAKLDADLASVAEGCGLGVPDKTLQLSGFGGHITPEQEHYVITDAYLALFIAHYLIPKLMAGNFGMWQTTCANVQPFAYMSCAGLPVDEGRAAQFIALCKAAIRKVRTQLGFDPGKRANLQALVRSPKYSAEVKEQLLRCGDPTIAGQFRLISDWYRLTWYVAYVVGILKRTVNGRCRARYLMMSRAGNGRVSISAPNLANSARDSEVLERWGIFPLRSVFGGLTGSTVLGKLDLPGAHMAIACVLSSDFSLRARLLQDDIHSTTTAYFWGLAEVTTAKYAGLYKKWLKAEQSYALDPEIIKVGMFRNDLAKRGVFLWLNGGAWRKLHATATERGFDLTPEDAQRFLKVVAPTAYPGLTVFRRKLQKGECPRVTCTRCGGVGWFNTSEGTMRCAGCGGRGWRLGKRQVLPERRTLCDRVLNHTLMGACNRLMSMWMGGEASLIQKVLEALWASREVTGFSPLHFEHDALIVGAERLLSDEVGDIGESFGALGVLAESALQQSEIAAQVVTEHAPFVPRGHEWFSKDFWTGRLK